MKLVFRIIGIVVVLVVLACALLWFLNEKEYLNQDSALSKFINKIEEHFTGISEDTGDFIDQLKSPNPQPEQTPQAQDNVDNTTEPSVTENPVAEP